MRRHKQDVSLLYLLAEHDMVNLLRVTGSVERCTDVETSRYGRPLFAAAAVGSINAFPILVDSLEVPWADDGLVLALKEQCKRTFIRQDGPQILKYAKLNVILKERTVSHDERPIFQYAKSKDILVNAVEFGNDALIALLIRLARLKFDPSQSMSCIVRKDYALSVESLITVKPCTKGSNLKHYESMLETAAEHGSIGVVEVLLGESINVHADVLLSAVSCSRTEIVKLIFEKGTNLSLEDLRKPYNWAMVTRYWRVETMALLFEKGPNLPMADYRMMLLQASSEGHEEIVRLLLTKDIGFQA